MTVPANLDAEQAVLGAILLSDETSIPAVLTQGLRPEDFYWEANQHVFAAIINMYEDSRHVDPLTLGEFVNDPAAIAELAAVPFSVGHLSEYARIVIDHAFLRRVRDVAILLLDAVERRDVSEIRVQVGRAVSLLPKDGPRAVDREAA